MAPIVIDFVLKNIPAVQGALRGISDVVLQNERQSTRGVLSESAKRQNVLQREAQAKIQAFIRADAMVRSAQRAGANEAAPVDVVTTGQNPCCHSVIASNSPSHM